MENYGDDVAIVAFQGLCMCGIAGMWQVSCACRV